MEGLRGPRSGGKRAATSATKPPVDSPAANDGPALVEAAEAAIDETINDLFRAAAPLLRSLMRKVLGARLPHLRAAGARRRARLAPEDAAPVDELTRARARSILERHGGGRR